MTFGPNTAANPVITGSLSTLTGGLGRWVQSIVYTATGIQTITFLEGFGFAGSIVFLVGAQPATLLEHFLVAQIGAYNATTRTLVLQQHRNGTAREVPADPLARISVVVVATNTSAP